MKRLVFLLVILTLALSACGGGIDSVFPIPGGAENFTGDDNSANFQVDSTLDEMVDFYRTELVDDWGLTERTLLTNMTAETVSFVFDGHDSGKAVVVQMVDLGNGTINVNIRFEDV